VAVWDPAILILFVCSAGFSLALGNGQCLNNPDAA